MCDNDQGFTCGFSCCVLKQQELVMGIWEITGIDTPNRTDNISPIKKSTLDLNYELHLQHTVDGDSRGEYICGVGTNHASAVCIQRTANQNCYLECALKSTACTEFQVVTL